MKKWAKVTDKGVFLQGADFIPPEGATEYMEYEDTPEPEWDKATQKLDGPVFAVVDGVLTKTYTVTDKTQDELDAELVGLKSKQKQKISKAHLAVIGGSVEVSLGFPMQFDLRDITMVRYAIEFASAALQEAIYLTDAENVNHADISIANAEIVLMEMGNAYTQAHARKQALRKLIDDAETPEAVHKINWETEV
jgi:hypothetical protein